MAADSIESRNQHEVIEAEQAGPSDYLAFLDECGDHSLTSVDKDFPVFVLSLVLLRRTDYGARILPAVNNLKLKHWDHEGVNLHSRDIRKAEGPFSILQNAARRTRFLADVSNLMATLPYELFIVGIRKDRLRDRYVRAANPYELALTFVMERVLHCLEQRQQRTLPLVAEARGQNEDSQLKATFYDLTTQGTGYVDSSRFQRCRFALQFQDKRKNIVGIQLADLCAHPAGRHILKPEQPNQAFDVIRGHVYEGGGRVRGWKVFP
jgi:hypothetical protein